jgi:hypothetical protein
MKPRTVFITLEIRGTDVPLVELRSAVSWRIGFAEAFGGWDGDVVSATANVAQPSKEKS